MRGRHDPAGSASVPFHAPTSSVWWISASRWTSMRKYSLRFFNPSRLMAADTYSSMGSLKRTLCCTLGFLPCSRCSSDGRPIRVANSFVASVSGSSMAWLILLASSPPHAETGGFEGAQSSRSMRFSYSLALTVVRRVCLSLIAVSFPSSSCSRPGRRASGASSRATVRPGA